MAKMLDLNYNYSYVRSSPLSIKIDFTNKMKAARRIPRSESEVCGLFVRLGWGSKTSEPDFTRQCHVSPREGLIDGGVL